LETVGVGVTDSVDLGVIDGVILDWIVPVLLLEGVGLGDLVFDGVGEPVLELLTVTDGVVV